MTAQQTVVLHDWKLRKGSRDIYDCEACGCWTANLPLYKRDICDAKERRFKDRRQPERHAAALKRKRTGRSGR